MRTAIIAGVVTATALAFAASYKLPIEPTPPQKPAKADKLPSLITRGYSMDDRKGLCVGGPYDGQAFQSKTESVTLVSPEVMKLSTEVHVEHAFRPVDQKYREYRYETIAINGEPVLYFWRHDSLTLTAALHVVFAAYAKGKK